MKPIIIIPAYNPDEKLIHLVEELEKFDFQMVVVNDGSNQNYKYIFEEIGKKAMCDICYHLRNRGKGIALKTGLKYASVKYPKSCGYVTADADGQHLPQDIARVAGQVERSTNALVLGTRDFSDHNIPFKSKWGNRITSFVFLLSSGKKCMDTQTGLRGIPKNLLETCLSTPGTKYEYEMNLLMEMARNEIPLVNIQISTVYLENNKSSHFHLVSDSVRIYYHILKYSLSSLTSTAIDLLVFTVMVHFLTGSGAMTILTATVMARLISGNVNFWMNKHWVFQSKNTGIGEATKYFMLFTIQMLLSWVLVTLLSYLPIPITVVKMLVDTSLFFISYQIQKKFIFQIRKARSVSSR